jgi:spore coat protein U-like protein
VVASKFRGNPAFLAVSGAALGLATPEAALAGTQSTTMGVSATVTANCSVSTSAVGFGSINPLAGSSFDATGSVTVTCTTGAPWTVAADAGGGSGATLTTRRMTANGNTLNYALYTDSGRITIWGDGSGATARLSGTGTGSAQSLTVYGRVPSGQGSVPAGGYSDTVNVTVTY